MAKRRNNPSTRFFFNDVPVSLLQNVPIPKTGKENPAISIATNFAMGIKRTAGKITIACAGETKIKKNNEIVINIPSIQ